MPNDPHLVEELESGFRTQTIWLLSPQGKPKHYTRVNNKLETKTVFSLTTYFYSPQSVPKRWLECSKYSHSTLLHLYTILFYYKNYIYDIL